MTKKGHNGTDEILTPSRITKPIFVSRTRELGFAPTTKSIPQVPQIQKYKNNIPDFYQKEYFYTKFSYGLLMLALATYGLFLFFYTIAIFVPEFARLTVWNRFSNSAWIQLIPLCMLLLLGILAVVFKGIDFNSFRKEYKLNSINFSSSPTVWVKKKYRKMIISRINCNWILGSAYLLVLLTIFFVFIYLYIYNSWYVSGSKSWEYTKNFYRVNLSSNSSQVSNNDIETYFRNFIIVVGVLGLIGFLYHVWQLAFIKIRIARLETFYSGLDHIIDENDLLVQTKRVHRRNLIIFLIFFAGLIFLGYLIFRRVSRK